MSSVWSNLKGKFMLSEHLSEKEESKASDVESATISPNDTPTNDVVAYRYQTTVAENTSEFIHGGHDIVEYYIPSLNLFFNGHAVAQSECPRNHTGFNEYQCTSPLTKVILPQSLVERIKSAFDAHKDDKINHVHYDTFPELDNDEIKSIVVNHISIEDGFELFTDDGIVRRVPVIRIVEASSLEKEKEFEPGYKAFGNDALLPYMLSSVHGNVPGQHIIDRICSIIQSMNSSEKQSLKASFEEHRECILKRKKEESSYSSPLYVGLGTTGAALALTRNPLAGFAAGIFASGLTFFKQSHDQSLCASIQNRFLDELIEQQPVLTK